MKTFPKFLAPLFATILLFFAITDSKANNITITSTTNWSAITTGSGSGGKPGASDNITVSNYANLIVDVTNGVCTSITLGGASTYGELYFNSTGNPAITVSGSITVGVSASGGTINMLSGTLTVGSLITNSHSTLQYGNGKIIVTTASSIGSSPNFITFNNLEILNGGTFSLGANISVYDSLIVGSATTLNLGSNTLYSQDYLTLNSNALISGTGILTDGGVITSLGNSTINCPMTIYNINTNISTGSTLTINGVMSGSGGAITLNPITSNTGTLVLTASNTYGYNNVIDAGTLSISKDSNLGAPGYGVIFNGGTLSVAQSLSINSARGISIGGSNCIINVPAGDTLICPNGIYSNGNYSLTGGGMLTLSGSNNFSGMLTVTAGQLNINNTAAITGSITLDAGTILDNTSGSAETGNYNFNNLTINGNFTFGGSNSLFLGNNPSITLNASPTITLNKTATFGLDGTINSSTQSITTTGTGTLAFYNADQLNSLTLGNAAFYASNGNNLSLKGSLTNNGTSFYANGGTVIFNGSSAQSISGSTKCVFNSLTLSNTAGLAINAPAQVNAILKFTSAGHISVNNNTLLLGSAATISGSGTSAYLVTGTGGKISRTFSAAGTFNFPLGDNAASTDYTPMSVHMVSATFPDTVGIFSTNSKDPNNLSTINYLNRYWILSQSQSGVFSSTLQGTYLAADVTGTEAQVTTGLWNGSLWNTYGLVDAIHHQVNATVSSFGDITGLNSPIVSVMEGSGCAVSANISGGTSPFTYLWNTSATTSSVSLTTSGTYSVTVTDVAGLSVTASSSFTVLSTTASVLSSVICNGGSNGNAKATVSGGLSPYTYSWSNGTSIVSVSSPTGTVLSAGSYTVTVTDAEGCTATASTAITQAALLTTSTNVLINVSCYGGSNGKASASPSGGSTPYTYSWSNGTSNVSASNPTGNVLPMGSYTVTVKDLNGCTATASAGITQPTALTATTAVISNISCNGGNTGNVSASPSGGNSPYSYSWSNGISTVSTNNPTGNVLKAGNFTVTVYDNNGCSTTASVTTTQPTAVTISTNILANEGCNGESIGNANATAGGGVSPYTYSWSNGTSTVSNTNPTGAILTAGSYTVTVEDSNGCNATALATVTQPLLLALKATSYTNVSCNGASSGSITAILVPDTFTTAFSFHSSIQRYAIPSGISSVIITAAGGQGGNGYLNTGNGGGGGAVFTGICSVTSGHVLSVVTGGFGGQGSGGWGGSGGGGTFVYDSNTITPLVIAGGGGGSGPDEIAAAAGIDLVNNTTTNSPYGNGAGGIGGNGGAAGLLEGYGNGAGGAGWISNGANGGGLSSATGGSDRVNGFGGGTGYTTNGGFGGGGGGGAGGGGGGGYNGGGGGGDAYPYADGGGGGGSYLNGTLVGTPTNGQVLNGYATIKYTVPGGTPPYTYSWAPTGGSNLTASGLSAGTYTLTLTDAVGCSATTSVTITQPLVLSATASVIQNVVCNGNTTGSALANASFGTSPYTYSWTNASMVQISTNINTGPVLSSGSYTVTVTDSCGASATSSVTITQPTMLVDGAPLLNLNVTCNGGNNGSATAAIPTGGISPYTYKWNGGATSTNNTNARLTAGTYTVTVTDANGCMANSSGTVTISQPAALSASATVLNNVVCANSTNGNAIANVTGGTGAYTYSWLNSNSVQVSGGNPTGPILGVGNYAVVVTDSCGASVVSSITITQTSAPISDAQPVLNTNVSCYGGNNGSAIASIPVGGTLPYTYQWNAGPANTNDTNYNLQAGTYFVTITDSNGCSATSSGSVTINQPVMLSINASVLQNVNCYGDNTGNAMVNATGGTSPFTFSWTDNSMVQVSTSSSTGSILLSGNYTITVSDNCGASATSAITIAQPAFPLADSAPTLISNIHCYGNYANAIASVATGGTGPYDYLWNGVLAGINDQYLTVGTYTVVVRDANGCTAAASSTITITQPSGPLFDGDPVGNSDVTCFGGSNGSATAAIPTGGNSPYTYQWNGVSTSTNPTNNNLSFGVNSVTVTDANGCTVSANSTVFINQPAQFTDGQPLFISNVSCYGGNNGIAAAAIPSGGTTPYTYQWNGGSPTGYDTNYNLATGIYAVNITDANGCTTISSDSVPIGQPMPLSVTGSVLSNVPCGASTNGNAMANISGGTSSYAFSWVNSGMITVSNSNPTGPVLGLGSYTVTVTDSCGVSASASVTITQTTSPIVEGAPVVNSNITCFGSTNGSAIAASPAGGTPPYTYQWNGGSPDTNSTISNLSAGTYSVMVTDLNGCSANSSGAITITQPAILVEGTPGSNDGCYGGYGSASASIPTGGTSPYNYLWSDASSATTAMVNNLTTGTYTISITDANGCAASAFVNIMQPSSPLEVTISPTNIACSGNTGSATAIISGGTNPYNDLLDFNDLNGGNPTGSLVASGTILYGMSQYGGVYGLGCVFSFNTNGNIYTDLLDFTFYNGGAPQGSLILSGTTLYGMTEIGGSNYDGCVFSVQTDGTGYVDIHDFDITSGRNPYGSLTLSGTTLYGMTLLGGANSIGCAFSVQTDGSGFTDILDFNGTNGAYPSGSFTLVGSKLYAMTQNGGVYGAGNVFSINTNGNVYADVFDFSGVNGYYASGSLVASGSTLYGMTQQGGNNGAGNIFSIDTAGNVLNQLFDFNAAAGEYPVGSLSISGTTLYGMTAYGGANNLGCTFSFSTNSNAYTDLLDFNGTNGANPEGDVTISGNTLYGMTDYGGSYNSGLLYSLNSTSYSYVWTPSGGTNKTASNLSAGTYTVTVNDANGCDASAQTTLTQPATSIAITIKNVINVQCNGGTGRAIANPATGGAPPYTYSWSPYGGSNDSTFALGVGTYTLNVTDSNGCNTSVSATITQPNFLYTYFTSVNNIYCSSGEGSATLGVFGGISPYTYLWNDANSQTTAIATGLSAGAYTVTVHDSNNCVSYNYVTISIQPLVSTANFPQENAIQNFTVPAGVTALTITATGAKGGGTGLDSYNGGKGTYMSGACTVIPGHKISVVVGQQGFNSNGYEDGGGGGGGTFVFDSNTGALFMVAGGGGGEGYSPNLARGGNGGNGGVDIATNMPTTSSEGCGAIVSGGDGGNRGNDIKGYAAGAGGAGWISNGDSVGGAIPGNPYGGPFACGGGQDRANHFLGGAPMSGEYNDLNAGGFGGGGGGGGDGGGGGGGYNGGSGGNDDTMFYQGGGGGGGASYFNGTILVSPLAINYGDGYVSIQYLSASLTVTAVVNSNISCYGESNGNVLASAVGGVAPYTYMWNDANSSATANVTDLSAGSYTVTATDVNGCSATASVSITQPVQFLYVSAGSVSSVTCNGLSNGVATVTPVGGNSPFTYSWSNGITTVSTIQSPNNLSAGTYTVTVQDNCGITKTATAMIIQPNVLKDSVMSTANITCSGGNGGSVTLGCKGGSYPYSFLWSNGSTLQTATGLSAGTYSVVITDQNGCSNTVSAISVTQPNPIVETLASISYPACYASKGSASVNVTGGNAPYAYTWTSAVSTTATATNLAAGTYTVSIKDAHRCTASLAIVITQPGVIRDTMVAAAKVSVSCDGGSDGSATVGVKYGTSPYTYSWAPNVGSTATVSGLSAGVYSVMITDKNGCSSSTAIVTITQPLSPMRDSVSLLASVGCYGGSGGQISVGTRGGTSPYTYAWNNGKTTYNITGLSAGTYTTTITDHHGCSNTLAVTVTQPALIVPVLSDSCIGNSMGIAKVTVSGGVAPYTYKWSNAKTTGSITVANGTYTVSVKDAHGCSETGSVTVNCPVPPQAPGKDGGEPTPPPVCCQTLKDIALYPNPNTGQFTITGLDEGMTVQVFDYTGRLITTIQAAQLTMHLNIADQPNGIYLIRIIDKNGSLAADKKVVKTQ